MVIYRYCSRMIALLLFLVSNLSIGQTNEKKPLTAADYQLWGKLVSQQLSDKGQWVSYNVNYESHQDTLFVRNTNNLKTHVFPKGKNGKFSNDDFFAYFPAPNTLQLVDLETGQRTTFENVMDFLFTTNNHYLILSIRDEKQQKTVICKTNGQVLKSFDNVISYAWSTDQNILSIITKSGQGSIAELVFMQEQFPQLKIAQSRDENFEKIAWSKNGKALSFYSTSLADPLKPNLCHYNIAQKKLVFFDSNRAEFHKALQLSTDLAPVVLSDDGERVFMKISENGPAVPAPDTAMVWKTTDRLLYPERTQITNTSFYGLLWPNSVHFIQITDTILSTMMLNGNKKVALLRFTLFCMNLFSIS